jgi:membrane-associated phospholipid phosphatase
MALLLCVVCSTSRAAAQDEVSCDAPLQEDSMRYPNMRVVPRAWRDLAALPASVVAWDDADWARTGAVVMPGLVLMMPAGPSLDVRAQDYFRAHKKPGLDKFFLKLETLPESVFLASYGAVLFGTSWLMKNERLFEYATLALETLAMTQFYHSVVKLLIGRESPYQAKAGEEPHIYGPTKVLFPGGTPSGHAATAWSMLFVLADYYGKWPLYVFAGMAGTYISAALVYRNQHYISDVIWGAGLGAYIARWIVRHRSSRYRCRSGHARATLADRLMVLPVGVGNHGFALLLSMKL